MPKVSVIVPVYNPGADIDDCIRSLLGQSMPAEDVELIFVDDGSTDATPARLDELAQAHGHVRVEHIPNSGWPGRPRNIGIDLAQSEYVYFVDNDDWLDERALERLHAMAVRDRADIVIGKVVAHGRRVLRSTFRKNIHGQPFDSISLLGLLTPHKLFRRRFLDEHALRFPEGRRRLEDHMFVVDAYFKAQRISVLADRPCYHWVMRENEANASRGRFDAEAYFDNVAEVLDLVESRTEPGPWRDRVLAHWYRGKMLGRVGGKGWLERDADYREELYAAVRRLALERFGEDVHERMAFNLRVRSKLLRAEEAYQPLELLARYETRLRSHIRLRKVSGPGTHLVLRLEAKLGGKYTPLRFERRDDGRVLWVPPEKLRGSIADADRDVTDELGESAVAVFLHNVADESQYMLPARTEVKVEAARKAGRVRVRLFTTVPIAPTAAAAGSPLPPGTWEVRAVVNVAGFSHGRKVRRNEQPLLVTTYPPGRIVEGAAAPAPPSLPRRIKRRMPGWVERALRRTRGAAAAASRG